MDLSKGYLAPLEDIRRCGHSACRVKVLLDLPPLSKSFACVVSEGEMANRDQPWPVGKHRQEEWMDEDDLLSGDLYQEQDLRRQLQRGNWFQGDPDRLGYKGRRTKGYGGCGVEPGDRESERGAGNKAYNQGRLEASRSYNQQRGWHQINKEALLSKGIGTA